MITWESWDREDGFISIDEGKALYEYTKNLPAGTLVLEIGCYHGKSTVALLAGCKESSKDGYVTKLVSVDYFAGQGMQIMDTTPAETAGGISAVNNIVGRYGLQNWFGGLHAMKSEDWFKQHKDLYGGVSLVFIDGCHQIVDQDVKDAWPYLKTGGSMLCHDFWPIPSEHDWITKKIMGTGFSFSGIPGTAVGVATKS